MSQRGRKNLFWHFLGDESGQTTTEYILILAVVVMIAMKFRETFKEKLITAVNNIGSKVDEASRMD